MMPHSPKAKIIPADSYPALMGRDDVAYALRALYSPQTLEKAQRALSAQGDAIKAVVLEYGEQMERDRHDLAKLYALAHEIRGMAETAGLPVAGRISENLCRYLDETSRRPAPADRALVALHVDAITSAMRSPPADASLGEKVAEELSVLVTSQLRGLR